MVPLHLKYYIDPSGPFKADPSFTKIFFSVFFELVYGEKVHLKHNNKTVLWEWKIKCGICRSEVQLHLDSSLKGRILYFQAHKGHFMQYLFTLLLIISTCQGHLYRTRKMNGSRQHNIWYTKLISVVFYILMRIAVQE